MSFVCRKDADRLADKLKKVTVAEIVERMEVSVAPFSVQNKTLCRIYKLKMKLHVPSHYKDWKHNLEVVFVRELENSIQKHVASLSRISGVKDYLSRETPSGNPREVDEDVLIYEMMMHGGPEDDEDEDEREDGEAEDLGLDARKQKLQSIDEIEYDNGFEEEDNKVEELSRIETETDPIDDEKEIGNDEASVKVKSIDKKKKRQRKKSEAKSRKTRVKKDSDRL